MPEMKIWSFVPLLYLRVRAKATDRGRYAVSLPTLRLLQQWTVVGAYGAHAGAREQLWRNHNGTSSTPRAELRVEPKLGGLASDNVLFEYPE